MPNSTSNVPTTEGSLNFAEVPEAVRRMRKEAIDDAAQRVLTAVTGTKMRVLVDHPGVNPDRRLFVIFVAPEVMARLRELTKEA